jgi:hypothetical protein
VKYEGKGGFVTQGGGGGGGGGGIYDMGDGNVNNHQNIFDVG